MKSPLLLLSLLAVFSFACSSQRGTESMTQAPNAATKDLDKSVRADSVATQVPAAETRAALYNNLAEQKVSLAQADQSQLINEAVDRKIIRNADLSIEVDSPSQAQHRITSIAESQGGFVVTSEAKQRENIDPSKRTLDIKLVVRIPSERFGADAR